MARVITLPSGRQCSLGVYVAAWRKLRALPAAALALQQVSKWDHFPTDAGTILREMRRGLHDRINRHDPAYGRGRKWDRDYQVRLMRDHHAIQDYRTRRLVRSGSGLETAEGRRAAPDVHERFRSRDF